MEKASGCSSIQLQRETPSIHSRHRLPLQHALRQTKHAVTHHHDTGHLNTGLDSPERGHRRAGGYPGHQTGQLRPSSDACVRKTAFVSAP